MSLCLMGTIKRAPLQMLIKILAFPQIKKAPSINDEAFFILKLLMHRKPLARKYKLGCDHHWYY